ncbi:MAG: sensor histidine kinase [Lautropia sp.]
MLAWFFRLSMVTRLPITAAVMIFVVAVATTQVAIQRLSGSLESSLVRLGQVYLDGLSAAVSTPLEDGRNEAVRAALARSLAVHVGIRDQRLAVVLPTGEVIRADRSGLPDSALPAAIAATPSGHAIDRTDDSLWVWRPLSASASAPIRSSATAAGMHSAASSPAPAEPAATVVANLDIADSLGQLRHLGWSLVGIDLILSAGCAWLGYLLMRRQQRPLALLARHLGAAGQALPVAVPESQIPPRDPAVAGLIRAYNRMARGVEERDEILNRMADQEREAVLGRLAAMLAHEIRNPLAGVRTSILTLRKFGDREEVRREALDFMERGVQTMQEVVDAALATHRGVAAPNGFGERDLDDIRRLVDPRARERDVTVTVESSLPGRVRAAGTELRQILLNLLLNAIAASRRGESVVLRASVEGGALRFDVIDRGAGLQADRAAALEGRTSDDRERGLGVAVVVRLMARLDGRIRVDAHPERGTHIALTVPIVPSEELCS